MCTYDEILNTKIFKKHKTPHIFYIVHQLIRDEKDKNLIVCKINHYLKSDVGFSGWNV